MGTNRWFSMMKDKKVNRWSWPNHGPFWIHGGRVLETEVTACYEKIKIQKDNIEAESMGKKNGIQTAWRCLKSSQRLFQKHMNRTQGNKASLGPLLCHRGELQWTSLRIPKQLTCCWHQASLTFNSKKILKGQRDPITINSIKKEKRLKQSANICKQNAKT